ncbi:MAG: hypothetical protein D6778_09150 [Nitrospirae bacterium]|nr:MAG: hypothetical protein D6778_09150 [Nitrospirota bacterium]
MKNNPYLPFKGTVLKVSALCPDTKHFTVDPHKNLTVQPGQFMMLSLWEYGEVPISISGINHGKLEFTIRRVGFVTSGLTALKEGDTLWLRGPYGRAFPLDIARGRDILIVAGGIGLAPLRPLVQHFVKESPQRLTLLYGARTPEDLLYKDDLSLWKEKGAKVILTVDRPQDGWKGSVGVVTTLWHHFEGDFKEAVAYVCGPPIMIRAALKDLYHFGTPPERIITTLEAHMKCGVGKCGHCYNGPKFICTDGPVFSLAEIRQFKLEI